MPRGLSLHIGLNHVDPGAYSGWDGRLSGCHNDAKAMMQLCASLGYAGSKLLLDEQATAEAILRSIDDVARVMLPGDLFVITFSGHGSQMADPWSMYPTVETWCAYDRQILGHELALLWGAFRPGCRVVVVSDSCHSGTITREKLEDLPKDVANRSVPPEVQTLVEAQHRYLYKSIWKGIDPPQPGCPVLLLASCQPNQLSADGASNGLFTEKLLQVWNNATFSGGYHTFHQNIVSMMPKWQTPNLFPQGPQDANFYGSAPFTF